MKKRILIFAHYYPPDVASTGQILKNLAEEMQKEFDVNVVCAVPSYSGKIENTYNIQKYYYEQVNDVKIIRVRVPEFSKTNKLSRIRNIWTYFWRALLAGWKIDAPDYIFTISQPPILGGMLGVCEKYIQKNLKGNESKMIYCIQDFNPEQIMAVGYFKNKIILNLAMRLDKFSCRYSDLVITVGRDLVETLRHRFKGQLIPNHVMINNWIDENEIYPLNITEERVLSFRKKYGLLNKFVIMYSGNMGLYYDLKNLLKVIENFKPGTKTIEDKEVIFAFVGDGSVREDLVAYAREHCMDNVTFIPYQDKEDLIYYLNAADVQWCVNAKGIKGVSCPSKFYGEIAAAKPVLGVLEKGSEVQMLIEEIGCGLCCEPMDYTQIEKNIQWFLDNDGNDKLINMGKKGYEYFIAHLTKNISIDRYCKVINNL